MRALKLTMKNNILGHGELYTTPLDFEVPMY